MKKSSRENEVLADSSHDNSVVRNQDASGEEGVSPSHMTFADEEQYELPWSLLTITIKSAGQLRNVDYFSKSDAYVRVEYRNHKLITEFVPNNLAPKWNQHFHFVVGRDQA